MNQEEQKITAYALGELQGSEKEEFEKELQNNPELQKEVDEIREITGDLEKELKAEKCPELEAAQREEVLASVKRGKSPVMFYLSTAAAAALAFGIYVLANPGPKTGEQARLQQNVEQDKNEKNPVVIAKEKVQYLKKRPANTEYEESESLDDAVSDVVVSPSAVKSPSVTAPSVTGRDYQVANNNKEMKEKAKFSLESRKHNNHIHIHDHPIVIPPGKPDPRMLPVEGTTERYGEYVENPFGMVSS